MKCNSMRVIQVVASVAIGVVLIQLFCNGHKCGTRQYYSSTHGSGNKVCYNNTNFRILKFR